MPSIQKLQAALAQSQQWGCGFKEEIKRLMEELTTKNSEIAVMSRSNMDTREAVRRAEGELKGLLEDKQRSGYKRDKLNIKLEELQARINVYQEGLARKSEWNRELTSKLSALEKALQEQQNNIAIEEMFEAVSDSKVSVNSLNSSSSYHSASQKSSFKSVHPIIDSNLTRLTRLESRHSQLSARCRQLEEETERQRKREARLKETLRELLGGERVQEKENLQDGANPIEEISRETRERLGKVKEQEERGKELNSRIQQERTWIVSFARKLEVLVQCEGQAETIRQQAVALQRMARKEAKAAQILCSYLLREH